MFCSFPSVWEGSPRPMRLMSFVLIIAHTWLFLKHPIHLRLEGVLVGYYTGWSIQIGKNVT